MDPDFGKAINCTHVSAVEVVCGGVQFLSESGGCHHEALPVGSTRFYINVGVCCGLVLCAGIFSGLTLGLLSLDPLTLRALKTSGKPHEQRYASRLGKIVRHHHLLLVTLLLANAGVNETLPLFLDDLVPSPIYTVVISVTAVLIFGEVIPQALCSRYGMAIGFYLAPFVVLMMTMLFVVAYPISKLLDCLLGVEHGAYFRRAELAELVRFHYEDEVDENEDRLEEDQVTMIRGILEMSDKTVADLMVELDDVDMVAKDSVLDHHLMRHLTMIGHSRVPVFTARKEDAVEYLLVKSLIHYSPSDRIPIASLPTSPLLKVYDTESPFQVLNKFQIGHAHIAGVFHRSTPQSVVVVKDGEISTEKVDEVDLDGDGGISRAEFEAALRKAGGDGEILVGIVTIEDILEEILQEDIMDEFDSYATNKSSKSKYGNKKNEALLAREEARRIRQKMALIQQADLNSLRAKSASMGVGRMYSLPARNAMELRAGHSASIVAAAMFPVAKASSLATGGTTTRESSANSVNSAPADIAVPQRTRAGGTAARAGVYNESDPLLPQEPV